MFKSLSIDILDNWIVGLSHSRDDIGSTVIESDLVRAVELFVLSRGLSLEISIDSLHLTGILHEVTDLNSLGSFWPVGVSPSREAKGAIWKFIDDYWLHRAMARRAAEPDSPSLSTTDWATDEVFIISRRAFSLMAS